MRRYSAILACRHGSCGHDSLTDTHHVFPLFMFSLSFLCAGFDAVALESEQVRHEGSSVGVVGPFAALGRYWSAPRANGLHARPGARPHLLVNEEPGSSLIRASRSESVRRAGHGLDGNVVPVDDRAAGRRLGASGRGSSRRPRARPEFRGPNLGARHERGHPCPARRSCPRRRRCRAGQAVGVQRRRDRKSMPNRRVPA